jgi:acyl-coenzyme A synthetase/AMP-(fatty) acid ligase
MLPPWTPLPIGNCNALEAKVRPGSVGRHQYPREIELAADLTKTETRKIQRFLLRGRPSPAKEPPWQPTR